MMEPISSTPSATVRCPTCRAVQEWSPTCRRCRCDLGLLRAVVASYESWRRRCLLELQAGRPRAAFRHARRCWELRPDSESHRLLAVAALLAGDWPEALAQARAVAGEQD